MANERRQTVEAGAIGLGCPCRTFAALMLCLPPGKEVCECNRLSCGLRLHLSIQTGELQRVRVRCVFAIGPSSLIQSNPGAGPVKGLQQGQSISRARTQPLTEQDVIDETTQCVFQLWLVALAVPREFDGMPPLVRSRYWIVLIDGAHIPVKLPRQRLDLFG